MGGETATAVGLTGLGKGEKNEHILLGQKIEHILLGRLIEHILLGHTVFGPSVKAPKLRKA